MSAKFKKGDVVMLVCRNIREAAFSPVGFNNHMERMLGEVHVIERVRYMEYTNGSNVWVYYMENSRWMWREDWLVPAFGRVDMYE